MAQGITITGLLEIAGKSVAVYVFILLMIRVFGKKELAQLSIIDLVFILLISNSVQNAMVGSDSTLPGGLTAALALFIVNFLLKQLNYRYPSFGKALQGPAVMLIYEGKIMTDNLKKVQMTIEELEAAAREHGVAHLDEVNLAVMETDGNISILSENFKTKSRKKRRANRNIAVMN
ncbi:MAG: DUF421 domain-containing protein [Chitinophagales bacterium]